MKPEIALKIDYDRFKEYTREQIETIRDEWIAAYREIAESDSSKKELCDSLTDRISRAAELFIRRHIEPAKSDAISHDDYYYEWLDEMKKEEDDSLDGNFPLGNEADMVFASPYFTIKELAMIQTGCSDRISPDSIPEYMDVRDGFLKETAGLTMEARQVIKNVPMVDGSVHDALVKYDHYTPDYQRGWMEPIVAYFLAEEWVEKGENLGQAKAWLTRVTTDSKWEKYRIAAQELLDKLA